MPDLDQMWGGDLSIDGTGDLLTVTGTSETLERVLRRLLSSPTTPNLAADDIWNPTYGAGCRRMIGKPKTSADIIGVIKSQLFLEAGVAQTPAPTITVVVNPSGAYNVNIEYTDAATGSPMLLNFDVA